VDIMKAAGLESPDISILSDDFLAEVRNSDKKNFAIDALKKLINGEVRSQAKRNVTQESVFRKAGGGDLALSQQRADDRSGARRTDPACQGHSGSPGPRRGERPLRRRNR